jgi:ribosomal protein L23
VGQPEAKYQLSVETLSTVKINKVNWLNLKKRKKKLKLGTNKQQNELCAWEFLNNYGVNETVY